MMLFLAGIIAICAVVALLKPNLINVLSDSDRKKIDPKQIGRITFWGLMTTALILVVLHITGIRNELVSDIRLYSERTNHSHFDTILNTQ